MASRAHDWLRQATRDLEQAQDCQRAARHEWGFVEGAPFEHYGPLQSEEAIRYASEVIEFVHSKVA